MKSILSFASLLLLASACADSAASTPKLVRLEGNLAGCQNVQSVCTLSEPPQCFDYCADNDPQPGDDSDCTISSDGTQSCGNVDCVMVTDDQGNDVQVCADPNCTVSHDAATGIDSFECPPSDGSGGGSGSEPGSPGDGSGGGTEPGGGPDGGPIGL